MVPNSKVLVIANAPAIVSPEAIADFSTFFLLVRHLQGDWRTQIRSENTMTTVTQIQTMQGQAGNGGLRHFLRGVALIAGAPLLGLLFVIVVPLGGLVALLLMAAGSCASARRRS